MINSSVANLRTKSPHEQLAGYVKLTLADQGDLPSLLFILPFYALTTCDADDLANTVH